MGEKHGPAHLGMFPQEFSEPLDLRLGNRVGGTVLGVEYDEENITIGEMVVFLAIALKPEAIHHWIGDIMVAGNIEKGGFNLLNQTVQLLPFGADFGPV